jgi:hypothetical protein
MMLMLLVMADDAVDVTCTSIAASSTSACPGMGGSFELAPSI